MTMLEGLGFDGCVETQPGNYGNPGDSSARRAPGASTGRHSHHRASLREQPIRERIAVRRVGCYVFYYSSRRYYPTIDPFL